MAYNHRLLQLFGIQQALLTPQAPSLVYTIHTQVKKNILFGDNDECGGWDINSSIQKDHEFQGNLSYIGRPCQNKQ